MISFCKDNSLHVHLITVWLRAFLLQDRDKKLGRKPSESRRSICRRSHCESCTIQTRRDSEIHIFTGGLPGNRTSAAKTADFALQAQTYRGALNATPVHKSKYKHGIWRHLQVRASRRLAMQPGSHLVDWCRFGRGPNITIRLCV